MTIPPVDVIVVAAGESRRMGGIDKLTAPIAGRPLLARTLAAVGAAECVQRIVLVVAPSRVGEIRSAPWLPPGVTGVVAGGTDRTGSVAAGLRALDVIDLGAGDPERVVLVHDGARPCVTPAL